MRSILVTGIDVEVPCGKVDSVPVLLHAPDFFQLLEWIIVRPVDGYTPDTHVA